MPTVGAPPSCSKPVGSEAEAAVQRTAGGSYGACDRPMQKIFSTESSSGCGQRSASTGFHDVMHKGHFLFGHPLVDMGKLWLRIVIEHDN